MYIQHNTDSYMWFHLTDTGHDHMGWSHMDPECFLKFNRRIDLKLLEKMRGQVAYSLDTSVY